MPVSKHRHTPRLPADATIVGIDHPAVDREMIERLLPAGITVPWDLVSRIGEIANSHPMQFNGRAVMADLDRVLDRQFRDAQASAAEQHFQPHDAPSPTAVHSRPVNTHSKRR